MFDSCTDIAAVVYGERDEPDELLRNFAEYLQKDHFRTAGLIQFGGRRSSTDPCLQAVGLPARSPVFLRHNRGRASRCTLDATQFENIKGELSFAINDGADIVIINRFGNLELEGRGFIDVIRQAAAAQIPVLIAVSEERFSAWTRFSEGMSVKLRCEWGQLDLWWRSVSNSHGHSSWPHRTFCEVAK